MLTLLRDMGLSVEERRIPIDEVVTASEQGTLRECFGTGTAATLTHVRRMRHRDRVIELPPIEARTVGPAVRDRLIGITTGVVPDPHEWLDVVQRQPETLTASRGGLS